MDCFLKMKVKIVLLIILSIAVNTINRLPQIFYISSILTTAMIISMAVISISWWKKSRSVTLNKLSNHT